MPETFNCSYDQVVEIHKIVKNPKNPNQHPERQIELLSKIIDYQGQRAPVIISKRSGFVVAGHGRLEAMQKLGWEKCAVDYQEFENEAQEYAHMVADNKIAELAEHDDFKMIEDLKDIEIVDFELMGLDDFVLEGGTSFSLEDVIEEQSGDDYGHFNETKENTTDMRNIKIIFEKDEYDYYLEVIKKIMTNNEIKSMKELFIWLLEQNKSEE